MKRAPRALLACLFALGAGACAQDRPSLQDAPNRVRRVVRPTDAPEPTSIPREWIVVESTDEPDSARARLAIALVEHDFRFPRAGEPLAWDASARWTEREALDDGEIAAPWTIAATRVSFEAPGVWMADLDGAAHLFVNGDLFVGDPERRGHRGVPVAVRAGDNDVYVVGARGSASLTFWRPSDRIVMADWDCFVPRRAEDLDASVDDMLWGEIVMPAFNASSKPCDELHRHYGKLRLPGAPSTFDWRCGESTVPLGLTIDGTYLGEFGEDPDVWTERGAGIVWLSMYVDEDDSHASDFDVALRPSGRIARPRVPLRGMLAAEPLWIVASTAGTADEDDACVAVARWLHQWAWYAGDADAHVVLDAQFDVARTRNAVPAGASVLYVGIRPDSNPLSTAVWNRMSPARSGDGPRELRTLGFAEWPDANGSAAAIVATDADGLRLALALDPLDVPADATFVAQDGMLRRRD